MKYLYLQLNWSVIDVTELSVNVCYERCRHYRIALWDIYAAVRVQRCIL